MATKLEVKYPKFYPEDASKVTLSIKVCVLLQTILPKNSRADVITSVDDCIRVLGPTKKIDVFTLAIGDPNVPLEETISALTKLVEEGKIDDIDRSEISSSTIEKATSIAPISLVEVKPPSGALISSPTESLPPLKDLKFRRWHMLPSDVVP
ncbi:hypothetical protein E8E14_014147 [Neopestalotiopsis sp. 37M]|nr:hypothetical protein E8E14_014147 [Neopestalotiopsis sp. 37M]